MVASLLAVAAVMSVVFLVTVRLTVARQIKSDLLQDVDRSEFTFRNLQSQRRKMLSRTAALIADLPSLKALMSAQDAATIRDGGAEFWQVSGSDLLILNDQTGRMVSFYNNGSFLNADDVGAQAAEAVQQPGTLRLLRSRGRLFEVLPQPVQFGTARKGFTLGYVTIGYELDEKMAREVQEGAAAQVAIVDGSTVVASTLRPGLASQVQRFEVSEPGSNEGFWTLGGERYQARTISLGTQAPGAQPPVLIVLKSFDVAARALHALNLGIATITLLGLLIGVVLAVSIAKRITSPIESLLIGTRKVGRGDFSYEWREGGAQEVRELSRAFQQMQMEIERTQQELLKAERMATIGHMASSVSHDLRHYLTSMYANAEFLCHPDLATADQESLLAEVKTAVFGMTDLLDSLLMFGRSGLALDLRMEKLGAFIERTAGRVKAHPDAQGVTLSLVVERDVEFCFDPRELSRVVYNLLLNACHAARRGIGEHRVSVNVAHDVNGDQVMLRIEDNGPGVPEGIRGTLFEPFVSQGKESGTGLGLALALRIAQAHDGTLELLQSIPGETVFLLTLPIAPSCLPETARMTTVLARTQ